MLKIACSLFNSQYFTIFHKSAWQSNTSTRANLLKKDPCIIFKYKKILQTILAAHSFRKPFQENSFCVFNRAHKTLQSNRFVCFFVFWYRAQTLELVVEIVREYIIHDQLRKQYSFTYILLLAGVAELNQFHSLFLQEKKYF